LYKYDTFNKGKRFAHVGSFYGDFEGITCGMVYCFATLIFLYKEKTAPT